MCNATTTTEVAPGLPVAAAAAATRKRSKLKELWTGYKKAFTATTAATDKEEEPFEVEESEDD